MYWAILNNEKIEPIPKTYGTCPMCERKVFSKCGDVNAWHWAHFKGENCDLWYEPESFWHIHWKMTFGKENAEITIEKNGKWHKADILTKNKVVIELQNSPIQKPVIRDREEFYGERMIWLINGDHFKMNFKVRDWNDTSYKEWLNLWCRYQEIKSNDRGKPFTWDYARKSWMGAQRNLFIDFGEESLFWIKEGNGESRGIGEYVSKERFINKYEGNYEYYSQQNPQQH